MTEQKYFITKTKYHQLRRAMSDLEAVPVEIPDAPLDSRAEMFHISSTNATVAYNGDRGFAIVTGDSRAANRTRSRLEGHITFKLIRIHEQLEHG